MQLLTVSELNGYLRELLEADPLLQDVWIEGEISNFTRHTSGHWYFTLKEGEAQISAACWRTYTARISQIPRNGDAVLAHGRIAFYEVRGQLQLYADMIRPAGIGILQAQFEQLKARLEAEGLFDTSRKRPLPDFPRRIGVVTSPTGAALQDILHVLGRRYPLAEVLISPCRVQGAGAADTIVEALYALYDQDIDLIIVARGGGSIEDLWAFNEEVVARAVFASPFPLISGVGHETDTTIIDYVADLRAPTPSAAAELAVPDIAELYGALNGLRDTLDELIGWRIETAQISLLEARRHLDARSPYTRIQRDRQTLDELLRRTEARIGHGIALRQARMDGLRAQLAALNPLATLERGYAVVRRTADGHVVTDPSQVADNTSVEIQVQGGRFIARRIQTDRK